LEEITKLKFEKKKKREKKTS
jgi:hypothetical protein